MELRMSMVPNRKPHLNGRYTEPTGMIRDGYEQLPRTYAEIEAHRARLAQTLLMERLRREMRTAS